ncbi:hypothetical protein [Microbacterium sp. E-13]|uniref:hypothetical protein n=1 Tax=Microbacterium sp. E-13 TaxID=3404048 RepID=UPI003CED86C8
MDRTLDEAGTSHRVPRPRWWVAALLAGALGMALAACGEYSPAGSGGDSSAVNGGSASDPDSPDDPGPAEPDPADPDPAGPADPDPVDPGPRYGFALPPSDTSVYGNDGPAYAALLEGCDSARGYLNDVVHSRPAEFSNTQDVNPLMWGFVDSRYAVLYLSALVRTCDGDPALARALASAALVRYDGYGGLDRPDSEPIDPATGSPYSPPLPPGYGEPECDLYRAFVSERDQVAPDTISCAASGPFPEHGVVFGAGPAGDLVLIDDPCTFDVDESQILPADGVQPPLSVCAPVQDAGILDRFTPGEGGPQG